MEIIHDYTKMGLTHETLYKVEQAMPYWIQFPVDVFIQSIVHEIREEVATIETLTQWIREEPKAASVTLATLSHGMTAGDLCDQILDHKAKLKDICDIAWEYATIQTGQSDETTE